MSKSHLLYKAIALLDSAADTCRHPFAGPTNSAETIIQTAFAKAKIAEQLIAISQNIDEQTLEQVDAYEV